MQVTTTTPLFAATLHPDQPLRLAGGWIGLAGAGLAGAPFLVAMPEIVLPGLVAYALAGTGLLAFGMRQTRRNRTSQRVTLWQDQLEIVTSAHGVEPQLQRFDPQMVRLRLTRDAYERTTGIVLRTGEADIELGAFLATADKSSFARAFGAALRQARRTAQ